MIIGGGCSIATAPVARTAPHFGLVQVVLNLIVRLIKLIKVYGDLLALLIFNFKKINKETAIQLEKPNWWYFQMGYSATSPQLSDRRLYPNFYRTGGSDMAMVAPIIALIKMFDWKVVATIHQTDPLFATVSL